MQWLGNISFLLYFVLQIFRYHKNWFEESYGTLFLAPPPCVILWQCSLTPCIIWWHYPVPPPPKNVTYYLNGPLKAVAVVTKPVLMQILLCKQVSISFPLYFQVNYFLIKISDKYQLLSLLFFIVNCFHAQRKNGLFFPINAAKVTFVSFSMNSCAV
jgi:hypothetical protein